MQLQPFEQIGPPTNAKQRFVMDMLNTMIQLS